MDGSIKADDDNEMYREPHEGEKQVYKRLHDVPAVAECMELQVTAY